MAVIGGTGVYDPDIINDLKEEKVVTPYGQVELISGSCRGQKVVFLNRHRKNHLLPPPQGKLQGQYCRSKETGREERSGNRRRRLPQPGHGAGAFYIC